MVRILLIIAVSALSRLVWAATPGQIASRYKVIGVIAEDKQGQVYPQKKGGIAVIKDTSTGRTLVLKAGLPFPGQASIKIRQIRKKGVIVSSGGEDFELSQYGFSGYQGSVASRSFSQPEVRKSVKNPNNRASPWGQRPTGEDREASIPPPPFPEEIDELFFQEFGEAPIPPEVFEDQGLDEDNRPLTREELMEKYDFDPEEFSNQELENMVSPPPAPPVR